MCVTGQSRNHLGEGVFQKGIEIKLVNLLSLTDHFTIVGYDNYCSFIGYTDCYTIVAYVNYHTIVEYT